MPKRIFLAFFLFSGICFQSYAQTPELAWAKQVGGSGGDIGNDITTDPSGNIYVTGEFNGIVDFDPGPGIYNLSASGFRDIFVMKLGPDGSLLWAGRAGGTTSDAGLGIHYDLATDHVYVTGYFAGTADFDMGSGVANVTSNGNDDIFVLKLTPDGNFAWVRTFGGSNEDIGSAIVTDASGNIFTTGRFRLTVDFNPSPVITNDLVASGVNFHDVFTLKLDSDGNYGWAQKMGDTASDYGNDIAVDASGNVVVTGLYGSTIATPSLPYSGGFDLFILKYNGVDGNVLWARGMGAGNRDEGFSISTDASSSVYLIGTFNGTVDFDPGGGDHHLTAQGFPTTTREDIFILKLNSSGLFAWAHSFGSASYDFGNSIATDASGNVYASGWFTNTADFDPSQTASFDITSSGDYDIFNLSLDPVGSFRWARSAGGGSFGSDRGRAIVPDGSGNVYATGSFSSISDFNAVGCSYNLYTKGGNDIFIQKLHANPPPVCLTIDQPADATVCRNATTTFTVNASGTTNFTYQWKKQNPVTFAYENLGNGSEHNGVTTSTLSVTPNAAGLERYLVVVSGDFAGQALSDTIELTVNDIPSGSPEVPAEVIAQCSSPVTFTASGETDGNYRWFDPLGNLIPGEVSSTYTTPLLTDNTNYSVAFANINECYSTEAIARATLTEPIAGWASPSFKPADNSLGSTSSVDDLILQPDGKIVINGFETGGTDYMVARLTTDGDLDPLFEHSSLDESLFTGRVDQIELQTDGKIIIAGRFTDINGTSFGRIARLNDNGSIDNAFNTSGTGFNARVNVLTLQPDGRILAGGTFTTYNATAVGAISRLNTDGSLDVTFAAPFEGEVEAIAIQSDGKIIVGGTFSAFDGTPMGGLLRLNADGTIDTGFTPPAGATANTIALQADNKIIIGGTFTTLDGSTHNSIARLNTDGTLDNSFDTGDGFDDTPLSIHVESTGKIVIGGYFQAYNNIPVHFLVRLLPDGTVDPFFSNENGANSWIMQVQPFATDTLIVAGYFDRWNGELQNGVVLVTSHCIVAPSADDITACASTPFALTACGGSDGQYRWYTSPTGTPIPGETNSTLNIASLPASTTYYVSLYDGTCESTRTPVAITVNAPPAQPVIAVSGNTTFCNGETTTLTGPMGFASYLWSTGETTSDITVSTAGSYSLRVNNGTCWSTSSSVVDITVNSIAQPVIAVNGSTAICAGGTVTLRGPDGFSSYTWSTTETTQEITVTNAGSYTLTVGDGQCTSTASQAVDVTVTTIPQPVITVTGTTAICNGETVTLTAPSGFSSYTWSSGETTAGITVSAPGSYTVQVGDGQCTSIASEAANVTLSTACNVPPVISSTNVETSINGSASIDLAALLSDPDNNIDFSTLRIVSGPSSGAAASIDPNQNLLIDYSGVSFSGTDQITIEVCDLAGACVQQVITIEVIGDIIVYDAISPNGDNLNDQWIIRYIDIIPGTRSNTVTIYNRWGDVLWTGSDYNNSTVVFRGENNNGNEIPTGTYFYKIELQNGRVETGYLALKR